MSNNSIKGLALQHKEGQAKSSSHTKSRPIATICFDPDKPSRLRTGHLMTIYGLSHSGLYKHLKEGRIPAPDGYYGEKGPGKRPTPYWLTTNRAIQQTLWGSKS